jgi:mono/diheme cytochrome c family protein
MQDHDMQAMGSDGSFLGLAPEAVHALGIGVSVGSVALLLILAFLWGKVSRFTPSLAAATAASVILLASGVYLTLSSPVSSMGGQGMGAMGGMGGMGGGMGGMRGGMGGGMGGGPVVAGDTPADPVSSEAMALMSDRELYEVYCYTCHGERGEGDGPVAGVLAVRPANIQEHLGHHPDEELIEFMLNGIPPGMPPAPIGEEEARRILQYLQTFPVIEHDAHE